MDQIKVIFKISLIFSLIVANVFGDEFHHKSKTQKSIRKAQFKINELERTTDYWMTQGQATLQKLVNEKLNTNNAKNVIFFLGDGMSLATVATARMYLGGEEESLSFENFPYSGFSKTYCVDAQVADSACTTTAYLSGIKTNYEMIGLNAKAKLQDCSAQLNKDLWTESILRWSQKSCKSTGIVTTTRITHASPAGSYAHVAERDWENDHEVTLNDCDSNIVDDIAEQLVHNVEGSNFKVILGGGRANFRNQTFVDEEGKNGYRSDGKDLIEEWKKAHGNKASYIWNKQGLQNIDFENTDYLLGLFEHDHMKYNLDVQTNNWTENEPTLSDMTIAAIKMLQKEENGYFLFVEGGMIDQAHHYNYAKTSLDETIEFSKAIEAAREMTSELDTLIVVTADHSHVFTYNGYPDRGSPIFAAVDVSDIDDLPYQTLSYANGPGYNSMYENGKRKNPANFDFTDHKLQYPSTAPLAKETHGGEDVGVWASGPMAHMFSGNYEQNSLPLIMAYILKVGPYAIDEKCSSCVMMPILMLTFIMMVIIKLIR